MRGVESKRKLPAGTIRCMSQDLEAGDPLEAALARIVSDAVEEWDRVQGDTVIYDEASQRQILGVTAEAMLELFATVDPIGSDLTEMRAGVFAALGELVGFAFSFKDPAWAEEQEWRAVYVVPDGELEGVQFRPSNGVAVPYVRLEMGTEPDGRLPIREIVQGPRLDTDTAVRSLEMLLASNGYSDVDITVSSVPLRA